MKDYRFRPPAPLSALPRRRSARMPHTWLRLFNGFADDPKWKRVASDAAAPLGDVIATVAKLLEVANVGRPRGSVADFSPAEWSLSLGVSRQVVDSIWAALEQISWIDREYITKWDRWQPDKEDPTRAERQARYRERKRLERQGGTSPGVQSNAVASVAVTKATPLPENVLISQSDRDGDDGVVSVAVTPRADTDKYLPREIPTEPAALQTWLYAGRGRFLVMSGLQRGSENYARDLIQYLVAQLGGDAACLAPIIQSCDGRAVGPAYDELLRREVRQQAAIIRDRAVGQASMLLAITGGTGA